MAHAQSAGAPEPQTRKLRVIAQDPKITNADGRILTSEVSVPIEYLSPGPRGYRVHVIDYDSSTRTLYDPQCFSASQDQYKDAPDNTLLSDPGFHAQNVYVIVMRTLAAFEYAMGRRVSWAFESHQLQVAPHAFAVANAFYSRHDQALLFGYFGGPKNRVFTCLSHDVVAHETTHALLDGLRERYLDPSSEDQFAFHEGFADVIALLSVFALEDVVAVLLDPSKKTGIGLIDKNKTTAAALEKSALFGLGKQIGQAMPDLRGDALRRSVTLPPQRDILNQDEFKEPHRRGEVFVAAMMKSFIHVWEERLSDIGEVEPGKFSLRRVVEDGSKAANHLMTMAIRALDYCPPTALTFQQYLSAMIAADEEIQPDDQFGYREQVKKQFAEYGIDCSPAQWRVTESDQSSITYSRTHFESMQHDPDEVFRFIWENRDFLSLNENAFTKVLSVRPCRRQGRDGFILHETVAEYVQIMNLTYGEVASEIKQEIEEKDEDQTLRVFGGGTLIFNEYGRLKYHSQNPVPDLDENIQRLSDLWNAGLFDKGASTALNQLHLARATALPQLALREETEW